LSDTRGPAFKQQGHSLTETAFKPDGYLSCLAFPSSFEFSDHIFWFCTQNHPYVIDNIEILAISNTESPGPSVQPTAAFALTVPIRAGDGVRSHSWPHEPIVRGSIFGDAFQDQYFVPGVRPLVGLFDFWNFGGLFGFGGFHIFVVVSVSTSPGGITRPARWFALPARLSADP
jgi:hypothetical protein